MLKWGIIEPSNSAYASPIVVVRKPNWSNRVCVDFRKLNKITIFDPEPMPKPEQIFAGIRESIEMRDEQRGEWSGGCVALSYKIHSQVRS